MTSRSIPVSHWSTSLALLAALTALPACSDDKEGSAGATAGATAGGGAHSQGGATTGGTSTTAGTARGGKSRGSGGTGEERGGKKKKKPIGSTGKSSAADIARKLGREPNFLIGMGNDLPK